MKNPYLFHFKSEISGIDIPSEINNPFGNDIPQIAKIAAKEFQEFIEKESQKWEHDFETQKGKMFGVLVVQREQNEFYYLATVSGKLQGNITCNKLIPSLYDNNDPNFFINEGMRGLTEIGNQIKNTTEPAEIQFLKHKRKEKSFEIQGQLFENYSFLNLKGENKNILQIFRDSTEGKPPSAAGECAAPKLLQYALSNKLKPIALAEFWWGNSTKNKQKMHQAFYPACKSKCRPILEFMLDDPQLFSNMVNS